MAESISGYAVRFNSETTIAGEFREQIAPGAFTRTLKERPDVVLLLNHDSGRVVARTSAGTLTLRQDKIGLWFSAEIDPTTPTGQEARGTVGRQDVKQCSFSFRSKSEVWDDGGFDLPLRTVLDADLYEISLCALPAYEATSAALAGGTAASRAEAAMRARGIA